MCVYFSCWCRVVRETGTKTGLGRTRLRRHTHTHSHTIILTHTRTNNTDTQTHTNTCALLRRRRRQCPVTGGLSWVLVYVHTVRDRECVSAHCVCDLLALVSVFVYIIDCAYAYTYACEKLTVCVSLESALLTHSTAQKIVAHYPHHTTHKHYCEMIHLK